MVNSVQIENSLASKVGVTPARQQWCGHEKAVVDVGVVVGAVVVVAVVGGAVVGGRSVAVVTGGVAGRGTFAEVHDVVLS